MVQLIQQGSHPRLNFVVVYNPTDFRIQRAPQRHDNLKTVPVHPRARVGFF
jgi:hypothetical protein